MQVYTKFIQHCSSLFVSLTDPSLTAFNHVELIFYLFVVILHFLIHNIHFWRCLVNIIVYCYCFCGHCVWSPVVGGLKARRLNLASVWLLQELEIKSMSEWGVACSRWYFTAVCKAVCTVLSVLQRLLVDQSSVSVPMFVAGGLRLQTRWRPCRRLPDKVA